DLRCRAGGAHGELEWLAHRQPGGEGEEPMAARRERAEGEAAVAVGDGGGGGADVVADLAADAAHAGVGDGPAVVGADDAADDGRLGREQKITAHGAIDRVQLLVDGAVAARRHLDLRLPRAHARAIGAGGVALHARARARVGVAQAGAGDGAARCVVHVADELRVAAAEAQLDAIGGRARIARVDLAHVGAVIGGRRGDAVRRRRYEAEVEAAVGAGTARRRRQQPGVAERAAELDGGAGDRRAAGDATDGGAALAKPIGHADARDRGRRATGHAEPAGHAPGHAGPRLRHLAARRVRAPDDDAAPADEQ